QVIERQNGLRQLRMNIIVPVAIWCMAILLWGIHAMRNGPIPWGIVMIVGAVALPYPVIRVILNRMSSNEEREVREVLTAFLAGHKTGLFNGGSRRTREGQGSE